MGRGERLALIDADSLLYYEAFKKNSLEECKQNIYDRLENILRKTRTNKYVAFLSCTNNFRNDIAFTKSYKGNRKTSKPKLFYELKDFVINSLGFNIVKNYEADDLVCYYKNELKNEYDCIICSPDKDVLKQCEGTHFNYQYKVIKNKLYKGLKVITTKKEADYFLAEQMLTGDSTDNILGIPKIGKKKADKILLNCKDDDFLSVVYKEYIKYYKDFLEATEKFYECFKLVYIIKKKKDLNYYKLRNLKSLPEIVKVKGMD